MAFESLTDRLAGVFKKLRGHGKLTEADIKAAMREVRMALLEADVNYKVAKDFCARVSERAMGQEVMESLTPAQQVVKIVNEELVALMGGEEAPRLIVKNKGQTIIMLCGLQGNGKTTHAAKLAKYFIKQGRRPMLVACDIYRPAAIDQLQVVGKQAGAPVFTLPGAKPPEIARKALAHARDYGNDIVILDTAGRLQIDEVLMQELVQIKEAVPVDETLLVVDAMAGQDAVNVAKTFNETVGIDGIILTKTDGDTRGGAALSVLSVTGKPIKFQGTGEKLDDLEVFHPSRMASRILGMGDVLSLIEKAQDAADEKAAEETARRMMENKFDMNDMLAQFAQIRKMGGAGAMLSMMPGMSGIDASQIDEKAFDRIEAMIYSMTKEEREKPSIINPKRKRRIAAGSGTRVEDVNKLLKQFEMMQKMMKQFKKSPKGFARRLGGMMPAVPLPHNILSLPNYPNMLPFFPFLYIQFVYQHGKCCHSCCFCAQNTSAKRDPMHVFIQLRNLFRGKSPLRTDHYSDGRPFRNRAKDLSCCFHASFILIRNQDNVQLLCLFQCLFPGKWHLNLRNHGPLRLFCRTLCNCLPPLTFALCLLFIQLYHTVFHGNRYDGIDTKFHGLLYDQFHLITFRKALKKIHLMGKLCPHFIGILYLCPDLFLRNFQNTAKIRSAALIADADFLPCLHAQHMTDMIDITAHNADPILLHLFIFHKKLVHTLLLLFLCGNIYPLTLMIDFHYSKSCCFHRFFYFVFLKINDAGSDKITTLF